MANCSIPRFAINVIIIYLKSVMSVKNQTNIRVTTADTELQFGIRDKTVGKALFDQVISTTGLRESWYFGIQYTDQRNQPAWLNMKKKLGNQPIKKEGSKIQKFDFKFKYYPENVVDEIVQDVTLKYLYIQVRQIFRPNFQKKSSVLFFLC